MKTQPRKHISNKYNTCTVVISPVYIGSKIFNTKKIASRIGIVEEKLVSPRWQYVCVPFMKCSFALFMHLRDLKYCTCALIKVYIDTNVYFNTLRLDLHSARKLLKWRCVLVKNVIFPPVKKWWESHIPWKYRAQSVKIFYNDARLVYLV